MQPDNEQPGWSYKPDDGSPTEPEQYGTEGPAPEERAEASGQDVVWSASAFIHHERGASWYAALFIGALALIAIVYVISKDMITVIIFAVLAGAIAALARRKPGNVDYRVASNGVQIDQKFYGYELFKSFSLTQDSGIKTVILNPLKRFMPPISMFYPPENEDQIVGIISSVLPEEKPTGEAIDRLARRLRF